MPHCPCELEIPDAYRGRHDRPRPECSGQEYAVAQDLTSLSLIEVLIAAARLPPQHHPAFPPGEANGPDRHIIPRCPPRAIGATRGPSSVQRTGCMIRRKATRVQILADALGTSHDAIANAPIDCIGNLEKRVRDHPSRDGTPNFICLAEDSRGEPGSQAPVYGSRRAQR
jgi:hypothetical protein